MTPLFGGFGSYLHICLGGNNTYGVVLSSHPLLCGTWRAAVSGPILFVLYIIDIIALVESYGLSSHLYAADTQV